MVRSLHYIKQLCVYLGSKCHLVVSSMGYFVSSITFPFSLSILQYGPKRGMEACTSRARVTGKSYMTVTLDPN